jgi:hypothetical protein
MLQKHVISCVVKLSDESIISFRRASSVEFDGSHHIQSSAEPIPTGLSQISAHFGASSMLLLSVTLRPSSDPHLSGELPVSPGQIVSMVFCGSDLTERSGELGVSFVAPSLGEFDGTFHVKCSDELVATPPIELSAECGGSPIALSSNAPRRSADLQSSEELLLSSRQASTNERRGTVPIELSPEAGASRMTGVSEEFQVTSLPWLSATIGATPRFGRSGRRGPTPSFRSSAPFRVTLEFPASVAFQHSLVFSARGNVAITFLNSVSQEPLASGELDGAGTHRIVPSGMFESNSIITSGQFSLSNSFTRPDKAEEGTAGMWGLIGGLLFLVVLACLFCIFLLFKRRKSTHTQIEERYEVELEGESWTFAEDKYFISQYGFSDLDSQASSGDEEADEAVGMISGNSDSSGCDDESYYNNVSQGNVLSDEAALTPDDGTDSGDTLLSEDLVGLGRGDFTESGISLPSDETVVRNGSFE